MTCRQARRLLSVQREWTTGEQAQVQHHLTGCPACQAAAREYELMDRRLDRLPEPAVVAAMPAAVQVRLITREPSTGLEPSSWRRQALTPIVLVAVLLVAVSVTSVWRAPGPLPVLKLGSMQSIASPTPMPTPSPAQVEPETGEFVWPAEGRLSQPYSGTHPAVDIASHIGAPVYAVADGTVILVGEDQDRHGLHIVLDHAEGYTTFYSHLSVAHIQVGEHVERGQEIGGIGNTGQATGPHLHFEIRKDGVRLNPFDLISRDVWGNELSPDLVPAPGSLPEEPAMQGFVWPTDGHVSQGYSSKHRALDIANHIGTPIRAAADGTVTMAGRDARHGVHLRLDHGDGCTTFYSHLDVALVEAGEWVAQGQRIGLMGNTGLSTGPHLHFEIHEDGLPVSPLDLLPDRGK